MAVEMPEPDCESGYSWDLLEEMFDRETLIDFQHWMRGQTQMLCDGRRYDHDLKQYFPTACANDPHGPVVYTWDLKRFLGR